MPKSSNNNKNNHKLYVGGIDFETQIAKLQKQINDLRLKQQQQELERIAKENQTKNLNNNNSDLIQQLKTQIQGALKTQSFNEMIKTLNGFDTIQNQRQINDIEKNEIKKIKEYLESEPNPDNKIKYFISMANRIINK